MKLSKFGRVSMALVASVAIGLGMTACGGGTVAFMWVLGTQYSQIAGFKVDNFTGNLTQIPRSPFGSGGANPVSIVVRGGGRYVYVVNAGTGRGAAIEDTTGSPNVSEFSVGGDGILTFQQSYTTQGQTPVWAAVDGSGNYLYVLDRLDPTNTRAGIAAGTATGNGSITVFAIDGNTGRLSLVTNAQVKVNNINLNYFPVGRNPIMTRLGAGCLFTLNAGDNTVFPYQVSGANGQLTLTTNSTIQTGASRVTSINAGGTYVYITDAGANQILPYSSGSSCALNSLAGGPTPNASLTANPVWTLTDSKGLRLYVLNQSTTNSNNPNSSITAFNIQTDGRLQLNAGSGNPYKVGAGPVCMVEDPTQQYVYSSNGVDGSVTGFRINQVTGELNDLPRGSQFPATGQATCLAISGNVT